MFVDITALDLVNSVDGNFDPNGDLHREHLIVPGALLISNIERVVSNPVYCFDASIASKFVVVSEDWVSLDYKKIGDAYHVMNNSDVSAKINLDPVRMDKHVSSFPKARLRKFPVSVGYSNLEHFCSSIHKKPEDLQKKYGNLLPPVFAAYMMVGPIQLASAKDSKLQDTLQSAIEQFPNHDILKVYRKQWFYADIANGVNLPFYDNQNTQYKMDFRVKCVDVNQRRNMINFTFNCAVFNGDKSYIKGQTQGMAIFQPKDI